MLLIGGWQDVFLRHTIEEYEALHGRGIDVALTVGPWSPRRLRDRRPSGSSAVRRWVGSTSTWPASAGVSRTQPVRIHVSGGAGLAAPRRVAAENP